MDSLRTAEEEVGQLFVQDLLSRAVILYQTRQVVFQLRKDRGVWEVHVPDEAEVHDVMRPVAAER